MSKELEQTSFFNEEKPASSPQGNKYDLISLLIKSMRIGDIESSLKCFQAMKIQGITELYVARKLVHFASEDSITPEAVIFAWSTYGLIKEWKEETNSIERLIIYLCKSTKMYATKEENYWELRRLQIRDECSSKALQGERIIDCPSYVYDEYTAKGSALKKKGQKYDRRFSGIYEGSGLFMRACYLKWQKIDPSLTTIDNAYSPNLLQCLEEQMTVDDYLKAKSITIDEFLGL